MANDTLFSDDSKLDSIIESFEAAHLGNEPPEIESHLPDRSDPDFPEIFLELLRVDMELRWRSDVPKRFDDYLSQFEADLQDAGLATHLAFEEYRLRTESGEVVDKSFYRKFPSVLVDDWPPIAEPKNADQETMSVGQASTNFESLPESISAFPELGDRVAGFRLMKQIGRGKFGRVFLAEQNSLSARLVVLKITTLKSIEPQRLAQLQHTNVVPIHSEHQVDGLQIVCMPYFGETTFADLICEAQESDLEFATGELIQNVFDRTSTNTQRTEHRKGMWPGISNHLYVDACIQLAVQIAEGLAHAHARGILHRDLKPANILLANDGRPLLLDFNLSEQIVPGGMASLLVGGTIPYMSPEQLRSLETPEAIDQRTDIFSFGVVLFELLTGIRPYPDHVRNASVTALIDERSANCRPASDLNPQIPQSICDVLSKCMSAKPAARYDRFEEIITDLNRHLEHRPLVHTPNRSLQERIWKWTKRNPKLLSVSSVFVLASVLVVSLVASWYLHRYDSRKTLAREQVRLIKESLPHLRVEVGATDASLDSIRAGKEKLDDAYSSLQIEPMEKQDALKRFFPGDESSELDSVRRETLFLLSHASERLARHASQDERQKWLEDSLEFNRRSARISGDDELQFQIEQQKQDVIALLDGTTDFDRTEMEPAVGYGTGPLAVLNLLRKGMFDDAIPILEQMRRANPLEFSTWFHLGEAYYAVGRNEDSRGCFSACIAIWPNSAKAYLYRGICYLSSQEFAVAEKDFNAALELRPDWHAALYNRAVTRRALKNYHAAESDLTRIIDHGKATLRAMLLRARVRKQLNNARGAKADFDAAMSLQPVDYRDYIARGVSQLNSDPKKALQDFQEANRLNPSSRKAMRNAIYVLTEKTHDLQAALEVAEMMVKRLGDTPDDLMSVAVLKARLGQANAAERISRRALRFREDGKLFFQSACVYSLSGDPSHQHLAINQLRKAVKMEPKWLDRLSDPDLTALRSHAGFRGLKDLADAYGKTVEAIGK